MSRKHRLSAPVRVRSVPRSCGQQVYGRRLAQLVALPPGNGGSGRTSAAAAVTSHPARLSAAVSRKASQRDGQRVSDVGSRDRQRDRHPAIVRAPAVPGGTPPARAAGSAGSARAARSRPDGSQARQPPSRAARQSVPGSASSPCWPSSAARPHDHITPLACQVPERCLALPPPRAPSGPAPWPGGTVILNPVFTCHQYLPRSALIVRTRTFSASLVGAGDPAAAQRPPRYGLPRRREPAVHDTRMRRSPTTWRTGGSGR